MSAAPTRRAFLRGAAGGALGTVLPVGLRPARALERVRRLILFVTPHQTMPGTWVMRRGRPAHTAFTYPLSELTGSDWSRTLAPLAPHAARLNIIEGLAQLTALPAEQEVNEHDAAHANLLTAAGVSLAQPKDVLGPSIDQLVARVVARPGQLASLELGRNPYLGGFSAAAAGQRVPSLGSPARALARVFPETRAVPGGEAGDDPDGRAAHRREAIDARRPGVAALAREEAARLLPELPAGSPSRLALDAHVQRLAELEGRLGVLARRASCAPPEGPFPEEELGNRARFDLFVKLLTAALACDRTRVVTLQPQELYNRDFGAPPGDVHQDIAHAAGTSARAAELMSDYNLVYARYFAHLLDELARQPEGEGTLLDSCLVVWLSEHGLTRAPHTLYECPAVLAGGAAGALRTGRYLSLARETPHPRAPEARIGVPHSHLLVSILQAMGGRANVVGEPGHRLASGESVPLHGPLPGL